MTFKSLPRKATYFNRINFLSDEYFHLNVDMFLNVTKNADFRHASCENLSLQRVKSVCQMHCYYAAEQHFIFAMKI